MVLYHILLSCSWLILSWLVSKGNAEKRSYMTYDMTTICKKLPNFKIRMHHSNAGSTGILKATDYLSEEEESECVAKITPPRGYGVIYHFEGMDLRKDANNDCRDYIKIYNESSTSNNTAPMCRDCCRFTRSEQVCHGHCGYESDGLICEEFCDKNNATFLSTGAARSLSIHYHTRCGTCTEKKEQIGFRMIFTAYKMHSAEFPDPVKAVIVASAVIVAVLLGVVLAYFPKLSMLSFLGKKRKTASLRLSRRYVKKNSQTELIVRKPSHSKSVSFQTPLPKIRELSISESEV
ncbi:hypothetical protein HNY73_000778 [Argiope bruennichi]|uniref:Uncharacterized protein n=1 Tax=Argiope bruennichi TaxID=94029 RepID=A0A8T0G3H1_ARGBR|nr:hypothetical protein HNY73_000778 [Argiope bruennichi]